MANIHIIIIYIKSNDPSAIIPNPVVRNNKSRHPKNILYLSPFILPFIFTIQAFKSLSYIATK